MNIGKTISIPTVPTLIDMEGLFGSSESVLTAKGTLHYCETDATHSIKARSQAGTIDIVTVDWIVEGAIAVLTEGASSINYSVADLNEGEDLPLYDGTTLVGFGSVSSVDTINHKATINITIAYQNITSITSLEITPMGYLEAGEQLEIPAGVKHLSLVAANAGDSAVFHTGNLKKKANSGLGSGSGGGGDTFTNATPTPVDVGGIAAGSTFTNASMTAMWNDLLYPYQAPAFTSFGVSGGNLLEVGETLPANQTATWSTSNSGNVNPNSVDINNISPSFANLIIGTANDGSETLVQGSITYNTESTNTWQIRATNSQGSNFNRNYNKSWYWRMYYGESALAVLTEADIKSLTASLLTNGYTRTYAMLAGATYKYIAYPSSFGTATNFTDTSTGFAVAMEASYEVSVTNAFGITTNYRVHRTTNILNSATNIAVS